VSPTAGLDGEENLAPTEMRSLGRPACSESLYRLNSHDSVRIEKKKNHSVQNRHCLTLCTVGHTQHTHSQDPKCYSTPAFKGLNEHSFV